MEIIKGQSTDGIIYTGLLSKADSNNENLILHIHGMSGDPYINSFYPAMHEYYPKNGWSFLAVEHRGTHSITQFDQNGQTVNIGNTFEIFEDCVKDIQGWINTAKELGFKNIWLQGHSLGPSKVAYYATEALDPVVKGLIFVSPSDMLGLVHDPVGIKDHQILLPEAQKLIQEGKPRQILSNELWDGNLISAQSYIAFFGENAKDAIFNYQNPQLGFKVVNKINLPVISFSGTQDDGIVPCMDAYEAMKVLESELKNSPRKSWVVFKDADHDFKGFGNLIAEEVIKFINS